MTGQTVRFAAEREDIQQAIAGMVAIHFRGLADTLDKIRALCESERHCANGGPACPACTAVEVFAVKALALLPERRADPAGEVESMRDRELPGGGSSGN